MKKKEIERILRETDYIRVGGTKEELTCARYLAAECEKRGVKAWIESFPVQAAEIKEAVLLVDGEEIPAKAYKNCGNADLTAEFVYLPNVDAASLTKAKGKVAMVDGYVGHFLYQDVFKAGAVGFLSYDGDVNYSDCDIDQRELRAFVSAGNIIPGFNMNAKTAMRLVKNGAKEVTMKITQEESMGESRNVVAEIPGASDEWIICTAHYDSTALSHGSYDNMTGCVGLLGIMEEMVKTAPNRYGIRFVFCGSEERGLLGSKAYAEAHKEELEKVALNINLDMIGSIMGGFLACCTSENRLVDHIAYLCSELGFGIKAYQGVYSSDSTPFADKGVPAVSFARITSRGTGTIHNRYDTRQLLSADQMAKDIDFITYFTDRMANAVKCPVEREIPENMKKALDEYLARKRPEKK